jgi:hypothetical protein
MYSMSVISIPTVMIIRFSFSSIDINICTYESFECIGLMYPKELPFVPFPIVIQLR